ncbi:DNA/RNA polymerase [Mycena sanguinolenta]|uniref:DNA/RNA polymerase n=1 Tax=Mycena sanguinolenta TaxID=230812 RepID=A0A8H6ZC22_9AGAR|nr:DNA/RNA polymerase [Mycena sanguinolenta]
MPNKNVRRKVSKPSARNKKSLAAEVADTGASLDATVGDGRSIEGVSRGDEYEYRAVTPPAVHATEEYLAEKWGIPRDELRATDGVRVTRRQRVTQRLESAAEDQEESRDIADEAPEAAAEPRQDGDDVGNSVSANVIVAGGKLEHWHLPAVDQNALRIHAAPRVRPYEIEEYFLEYPRSERNTGSDSSEEDEQSFTLRPAFDWNAGWTRVGKQRGRNFSAHETKAPHGLIVQRKFFPDEFSQDEGSSDEEEDLESEPDSPKYTNFTIPKLPNWNPIRPRSGALHRTIPKRGQRVDSSHLLQT